MKLVKLVFTLALILFTAGVLHYFLPSRDIVQIVGTDVKRMDVDGKAWFWDKADAGTNSNSTRDVRFISATFPNGNTRVYRNEDTGWSFPPYFKFDSGDLNAAAQSLSKQDGPQWVAVRHYGWRVKLFSIFPNATSMKKVSGPDALLIPWFNIVFLSLLAFFVWRIWAFLRGVKQKHVDPVTEDLREMGDKVEAELGETRTQAQGFLKRWIGSSKE